MPTPQQPESRALGDGHCFGIDEPQPGRCHPVVERLQRRVFAAGIRRRSRSRLTSATRPCSRNRICSGETSTSLARRSRSPVMVTAGGGTGIGSATGPADRLREQQLARTADVDDAGVLGERGDPEHLQRIVLMAELDARVIPQHGRHHRQRQVPGERALEVWADEVGEPQHASRATSGRRRPKPRT